MLLSYKPGSMFFTTALMKSEENISLLSPEFAQRVVQATTRVQQKVLSLGSDYFSATFYQTYFYYKPSKYSPFSETHFCHLFTQSSFGICWRH